MAKEDDEDFENSTKCLICDVKVRDCSHIIGKYKGSVHEDCNIKVN